MPVTHNWNGFSQPYLFDPANYLDGGSFNAGDTLLVGSGHPSIDSKTANPAPLVVGTYQFSPAAATADGFDTTNVDILQSSVVTSSGTGTTEWLMFAQLVNDGIINVGTATAAGTLQASLSTTNPVTLTNHNTIDVQNGSLFRLQPITAAANVVNAVGASIDVLSGSALTMSSIYGYAASGVGNVNTVNNGVITVIGAAGRTSSADFEGSYTGSGLLSVRGVPGAAKTATSANIAGAASGTFDVASGQLEFQTTPVGGSVNFLDNDGALVIDRGAGISYSAPGFAFGATINGFQAGDPITLSGPVVVSRTYYDATQHMLTLYAADGSQQGQFNFAGNFVYTDLQVTNTSKGVTITTTSPAQAAAQFSYTDTTSGAASTNAGQAFSGPVNYLQSQYVWSSPDGVAIRAGVPNAFLQSGSGNDAIGGNNVLDGGTGSSFLTGSTGGTGADGGKDTFFLDGTVGTTWDTIVNFHAGDSVTLWGFHPGSSSYARADNAGAPGATGATLHATFAGAGAAPNASITFAGIASADALTKFSISSGNVGGRDYLYIHDVS